MATATGGIMRPVKQVEDLAKGGGSGNQPFPEGAWQGTIESTRVRNLPFLAGKDTADLAKQGYTSEDVEVVSLQIASNTPLEGQAEVGNKKFFTPDIVVRDGAFSINDAEIPKEAWQLAKSQDKIINLARALSATETVEVDGVLNLMVTPDFVETLVEGGFDGQTIGYVVKHRKYNKKDGTTGTEEQVSSYLPAV